MTEETEPINYVTWDIHTTHPDLVEPLREKFKEVVDPEIGLTIIELGLIRNVSIEDDKAEVYMILTTPFCPYGPAMLDTTKQKALEALDMDVNIELGFEPWDFSLMENPNAIDWGMYT